MHATRQSGMTLPELLISIVIVSIIVTGIYNLFRAHNLMAARQEETTRMQQDLLSAIFQISDDLRMCGYSNTGANLGFNATATNATSVYCAKDPTGLGNNTEIGYRYNAANSEIEYLISATNTWEPVAEDISELSFVYFDSDGNNFIPINSNIGNIRYVEITATAIASPERTALNIGNRTMTTRVYCRNMGI